MKTFKLFFTLCLASIFVLSVNSCKKEKTEELGPYYKIPSAETLKGSYSHLLDVENGAQIVDYRSQAEFVAGHIPGAINIPATIANTASDDADFCKKILARCNKSTPVLLYGKKSAADLEHIVPGRVSKIGYGYDKTFVLLGGFEGWKKAYPTEIQTGR